MATMKFFIGLVIILLNSCIALNVGAIRNPRQAMMSMATEGESSWPGNRPPVSNPLFLKQRMDAAWGRGKFRSEVWDDDVNPLNDWWLTYEPSQEDVEAAVKGFDFSDPEGWCKANNIDFAKASAELKEAQEKTNHKMADAEADVKVEDFSAVQEQYFKLLDKFFLTALLVEDDLKQAEKGQPSLLNEDTGYQYKNDS